MSNIFSIVFPCNSNVFTYCNSGESKLQAVTAVTNKLTNFTWPINNTAFSCEGILFGVSPGTTK